MRHFRPRAKSLMIPGFLDVVRRRRRTGARPPLGEGGWKPTTEGICEEIGKRKRKQPLPDEKRRGLLAHLISPGRNRVGFSTSIAFATGCCGFNGPAPSATLDKIPNQVVRADCRRLACPEQWEKRPGPEIISGPGPDQ